MHGSRQVLPRAESGREVLMRRMAAGDQRAMAEFYDQTSDLVFGLALRIVGERQGAEDVVVEAYAQVWTRAADYDPARGSAVAWLLTVTRSRAVDLLRVRQREQPTEPLDEAQEVPCERPGPEALSASAECHRVVRRALAALSNEMRQVIEMAYFAGLSHSEIADRLDQPLGTVKTRIRSAMMQLRAQLAPLHRAALIAEGD